MSDLVLPIEPRLEGVTARDAPLSRRVRIQNRVAAFRLHLVENTWPRTVVRARRLRYRMYSFALRVRARGRRTKFGIGAAAHSSATLAGISKDAHRAAAAVKKVVPADSPTVRTVRSDVGRAASATKSAFTEAGSMLSEMAGRAKARALRSSTLTGLAIDGHRIAKRLHHSRDRRRGRFAH